MENVVHAVHGVFHAGEIPDVADEELDLLSGLRHLCLKLMAHIVLLLLIPGENADLPDVSLQKAVQNGVAERAGAAGDHQCFSRKVLTHFSLSSLGYIHGMKCRISSTYCSVAISVVYFSRYSRRQVSRIRLQVSG